MTTSSMTTTATGTTVGNGSSLNGGLHLNIPKSPNGSALDLRRGAFRRTYSSNSIKKKSVEVTPSSFVKIRLLGKGDVGKVYLVRQKDTDRLYAMKGKDSQRDYRSFAFHISAVDKRFYEDYLVLYQAVSFCADSNFFPLTFCLC